MHGRHVTPCDIPASLQVTIPAKKKARIEGSKDDLFGSEAGGSIRVMCPLLIELHTSGVPVGKARKRTEEGYAIYTEEELGLGPGSSGRGGDTDLCPFDCDCCF